MTRFDLCANSATLSAEQKTFGNQMMWDKLDQVTGLYDSTGAGGNLYLGGSVGLRQPSLKLSDGRTVGVKSDLDLFYLIPGLPPSSQDLAFLQAVTRLPQDIEVSIHLMPAVQVDEPLFSPTVDDIVDSLRRPLREGFEFSLGELARPFQEKTAALFAARMMGTAVAPYYVATHQFANLPGDRIERDSNTTVKVAITLLRYLCYTSLAERFSYAALLELAEQGFFEGVCARDTVHELVRRREQWDPQAPPLLLDHRELFRRVAARDLDLPAESATAELCEAFIARHLAGADAMENVHALLLPVALWAHKPEQGLLDLARRACQRSSLAGALGQPLAEESQAFSRSDSPTREAALELVARLVHAAMKSVTDSVQEKLARATARRAVIEGRRAVIEGRRAAH
jgi:hypothetical protein